MLLESSLLVQAIVVALLVVFASGVRDLIGFTMLDRPIFICPIVGWLFGDIQQGLLIGASLEAVFMGVVNVGGASSAECGIASVVGTAFAMKIGGGTEVALPLALPIGLLGLQVKNLLFIFLPLKIAFLPHAHIVFISSILCAISKSLVLPSNPFLLKSVLSP